MATEPTEISYAGELKSIIDSLNLAFHAEIEKKLEGKLLRVDLLIHHKDQLSLIVEVKRPEAFPSLSDGGLLEQAKEYANFLVKKHTGLRFVATHNLKHLMLFERRKTEKKTLQDFEKPEYDWFLVKPFPWNILPMASRLSDYEANRWDISSAMKSFLLDFKAYLEGKAIDIRPSIVQILATSLREIAEGSTPWFYSKYKTDREFQRSLEIWLAQREIRRPKNDDEAC